MLEKYCIYLRKSRVDIDLERSSNTDTLSRHEKTLFQLAESNGIHISKTYRELVSGDTIAARPMMQLLLNEVSNGLWTAVLVMELERLARGDSIDQGRISRAFTISGTKIITPQKTYDPKNDFDQEFFEFGLFMSRREYKAINRRLQQGRLTSIQEGKYLGSTAPYGYRREKLKDDRGYSLVFSDEAEILREIFVLFDAGNSVADISEKLNSLQIPSAKNGKWTTSSIRTMLRNPVYNGKIRWNARPGVWTLEGEKMQMHRPEKSPKEWILVDGLHTAIVDDGLWSRVQKRLSSQKKKRNYCAQGEGKSRSLENPLAGLIICGICGQKMQRRTHGSHGSPSLICPRSECKNVGSRMDLLEKELLKALENHYEAQSKTFCERLFSAGQSLIREPETSNAILLKHLCKSRIKCAEQIDRAHDLLEQGIYNEKIFEKRLELLNDRMRQFETREAILVNAQENSDIALNFPPTAFANNLLYPYYIANNIKDKNEWLSNFLEKAEYTRSKNEAFHLKIYPRFSLRI